MTEKKLTKEELEKIENSTWSFFIRKRPVAWLLTLAIIIFGLFSLQSLPREINPEINIPIATISTSLPGANPTDIESLITEKIEKEVANLNDIESLTSTSGLGFSSIIIEFSANSDIDKKVQETKDAVELIKNSLPEDATDPLVSKSQEFEQPVVTFSIIGDLPLYELSKIAEDFQNEIEKISGVASAEILGGQEKEIHILLNQREVENYGLSIQEISNAINSSNNNLPIGIVNIDEQNYSVRIDNRFNNLIEISEITIRSSNEENASEILLKDIADIKEVYPDSSRISKFSIKGEESKQAISIRVRKKKGGNTLEIVDTAKEKVENLKRKISTNIEVAVSNDNSQFIREDLSLLTNSGIQTTFLIIFTLFLALGFVEGLLAGLSIPLTFLSAFTIMNLFGMSINGLSLFALVIALGLMVDTAIVVMEGIFENMKNGYSAAEAAKISVYTYKLPLLAGTFTTVFAFFPMLLVSGILGEFLKTLPITISAALFSSLFISLTINPSIAAKFLNKKKGKEKTSILEPLFNWLGKVFSKVIGAILSSGILKFVTILVSIILFVASLSLPARGILKAEQFPVTDINFFYINIELPSGIITSETEKISNKVEEILYGYPEIDNFLTVVGGSNTNRASITVNLVNKEERTRKSFEIAEEIDKNLKSITGAKINVEQLSSGPPTEAPITVRITGSNFEDLEKVASDIEEILSTIPNTLNINNSLVTGLNEFKFELSSNRLAYHGLTANQVSFLIRNIIQGVEIGTVNIEGEESDLFLKYDLKNESGTPSISISEIENLEIPSPKGYNVSLKELGRYEYQESLSNISREEQKRIVKVTSFVTKQGNSTEITNQLQERMQNYQAPGDVEIAFGGDLEAINESFRELYLSMSVGIVLIMFTLVLIFNSFKQPFVILLTLPLALIGVFPGLYLVGQALSFPAFLGVVALTGVVVNDAIVLIDRINSNRARGLEFKYSIQEAAEARLQPIFMTSITTIVGILPLALTNEFWAGLGYSLIFGLACATLLTLIVIPVLYYLFEARAEKKKLKKLKKA